MTVSIIIGEKTSDKECVDMWSGEKYIRDEKDYIRECPKLDYDLCNPELTVCPRRSYRTGTGTDREFGIVVFIEKYMENLGFKCNDEKIYQIKPILEKINALPDGNIECHRDRMKWLKFWANRAVELYGDNAFIRVSW